MHYNIINSGSDGNCTIVNDIIAIDCGVSYKRLSPYVKNLKLVFISHKHTDHFNRLAVKKLAKERPTLRFAIGKYLRDELLECGVNSNNIDIIEPLKMYDYGLFSIEPVKLYHDVPNMGLRLFMNGKRLIYMTDTRTLDGISAKNYDVYLVEGNYENAEELHSRAYNEVYEERVKNTHLSREYTSNWLLGNMGNKSEYVFMHQHKERNKKNGFNKNYTLEELDL